MQLLRYSIIIVLLCNHKLVISSKTVDFFNAAYSDVFGYVTKIVRQISNNLGLNQINVPRNEEMSWITRIPQDPNESFMKTYNEFVSFSNKRIVSNNLRRLMPATGLLTLPQMAAQHGMQVDSHEVLTRDGYILTLHHLMLQNVTKPLNQSVLLHHGLLGSSMDWFLREPNKSLPAILSAAGYDVWMANARGNIYSRRHISMNVTSQQYWLYSWQEMGEFDLPAVIDYILHVKKNNSTISFVGHSMGATAMLVTLTSLPHYNRFLRIGILLAPLAFMGHTNGPLKDLALLASHPSNYLLGVLGTGEIFPSRMVPEYLMTKYCAKPDMFCQNPVIFACGNLTQKQPLDSSFVNRVLSYTPGGGSTRTMMHYAQMIATGRFHAYNNPYAEFPLKSITLPIAIFSSANDRMATIPGVERLYLSIANPISHFIFHNEHLSHTEFVWGSNMDILLYNNITELIGTSINGGYNEKLQYVSKKRIIDKIRSSQF